MALFNFNPNGIFGFFKRKKGAKAEMSFWEHIEDLRWHIIRIIIAIAAAGIAFFANKKFLFDDIIFAPKNPNFITYRVLCWLGSKIHVYSICRTDFDYSITNMDLAAQFMTHIRVSFMMGLIAVFPYVLFEIWTFVKPALYEKELKNLRGVVVWTAVLFYIGILFGYFVLMPMSVNYLGTYHVSDSVRNTINLTSFIDVVTGLVFITGLVFEFPMVIFFVAKLGLVGDKSMRQFRRFAIVGVLVVAMLITPSPDVFSQILVAVPLYILYEVSILVAKRVVRQREKKERDLYGN
jgi:sec-independent protein translocase protein TatC